MLYSLAIRMVTLWQIISLIRHYLIRHNFKKPNPCQIAQAYKIWSSITFIYCTMIIGCKFEYKRYNFVDKCQIEYVMWILLCDGESVILETLTSWCRNRATRMWTRKPFPLVMNSELWLVYKPNGKRKNKTAAGKLKTRRLNSLLCKQNIQQSCAVEEDELKYMGSGDIRLHCYFTLSYETQPVGIERFSIFSISTCRSEMLLSALNCVSLLTTLAGRNSFCLGLILN